MQAFYDFKVEKSEGGFIAVREKEPLFCIERETKEEAERAACIVIADWWRRFAKDKMNCNDEAFDNLITECLERGETIPGSAWLAKNMGEVTPAVIKWANEQMEKNDEQND